MRERPLQPWRWQLASSWLLALLALAGLWAAVSLGRTPAATAAPNTPNVPIADWCAAGDFNGWNNNGTALLDDGTNGDCLPAMASIVPT